LHCRLRGRPRALERPVGMTLELDFNGRRADGRALTFQQNYFAKRTGANGRPRSSYNSINMTLRICLDHQRQWNPMKLCLILYGHMALRLLIPVRKLDVPEMGLPVRDKFVSLMRLMQIVSTRPALICSMASRPRKIFLYLVRMFQMPSLRLLHRNRGFTSDQIRHSMSGGPSTRNAHQSLMAT